MDDVRFTGADLREFCDGFLGGADIAAERRNAETLHLLYQQFNENKLDLMIELVTEDYESVDIAAGDTARGRVAYRRRQEVNRTALPDATAVIKALYLRGSSAVAEVVNRGTHTGPLQLPDGQVIPPTGRRVEGLSCEVYEFRDGKIAKGRLYYDFLTVAKQLGLPSS
jgi:ketosteroid isomerase-like protein